MRIGVIGCGNISDTYLKSQKIYNNVDIVACADIISEVSDKKAKEYNIKSLSVEDLLNSKEVEIIWEQGSNEVSTLKGTISRRDSIVNPQDGGGKVFASLPSPSQNFSSIPPGAFVKVRYPVGTLFNVVKLPEEAIYEGNSVFIIKNGYHIFNCFSISSFSSISKSIL